MLPTPHPPAVRPGTALPRSGAGFAAGLLAVLLALVLAPASPAHADPVGAAPAGLQGYVQAWGDDGGPETRVPESLLRTPVTAVAAGNALSLALTAAGRVVAWGQDQAGDTQVPASLTGRRVTAIAASWQHALALTEDGTVTAWGDNDRGESVVPASLAGRRVTLIAAGKHHSLAVTADGAVTAWGANEAGQTSVPPSLTGTRVVAIAAGADHSLAVTAAGRVVGWGDNSRGQVEPPAGLTGLVVTAVAAGDQDSLALTDSGSVLAWGNNGQGQTDVPPFAGRAVAVAASPPALGLLTDAGDYLGWGRSGSNIVVPSDTVPASFIGLALGEAHVVVIGQPDPGFFVDRPPDPAAGYAYEYRFLATGSPAPSYELESGTLPPGLRLSSDGVLAGTPYRSGSYTFRLRATGGGDPDALSAVHTLLVLAGEPSRTMVISGDGESAKVGQHFPSNLVCRITDRYGNPIDPRTQIDLTIDPDSQGRVSFDGLDYLTVQPQSGIVGTGPLLAGDQPGPVRVRCGGGIATLYVLPADAPEADVRTTVSVPVAVRPRQVVRVRVTVANTGLVASRVVTPVTLPDGWAVLSAPGSTRSGSFLTYPSTTLAGGTSRTYVITVRAPGAPSSATLTAKAGSSSYDPNPANNQASAVLRVRR